MTPRACTLVHLPPFVYDVCNRMCYAVELDFGRAVMLGRNIELLNLADNCTIINANFCDVRGFMTQDAVFFDPPYVLQFYEAKVSLGCLLSIQIHAFKKVLRMH